MLEESVESINAKCKTGRENMQQMQQCLANVQSLCGPSTATPMAYITI
jgi:hypothetical protein